MKNVRLWFRVVSALVLLAGLMSISGASASTGRPVAASYWSPVNVAWCVVESREVRQISSDPEVLVLVLTDVFVPDVGPGGKEGFEGMMTERTIVRVLPNSPRQAGLYEWLTFDGKVWEAGNPDPWTGHLNFLDLGSGGPSDNHGTMRTIDSSVHFVGAWTTTPESNARCESLGYPLGGSRVTGRLHITPARR